MLICQAAIILAPGDSQKYFTSRIIAGRCIIFSIPFQANSQAMIKLGQYSLLRVIKKVDFGLFLDGGKYGDILLPRKYADKSTAIGDEIEVFVYLDSEDRIVATTLKPKAVVGECAYLKVIEINDRYWFYHFSIFAPH